MNVQEIKSKKTADSWAVAALIDGRWYAVDFDLDKATDDDSAIEAAKPMIAEYYAILNADKG